MFIPADLVVFDSTTIGDTATYEAPIALASGVEEIWVNGRVVWKDDGPTGNLSGRVLRQT